MAGSYWCFMPVIVIIRPELPAPAKICPPQ